MGLDRSPRYGQRSWRLAVALFVALPTMTAGGASGEPVCVIDMGSNTVRRIVGSFEHGRYEQGQIDKVTLGVGEDLARHGRISDPKLIEIEKTLAEFGARRCHIKPANLTLPSFDRVE